MQFATTHWSVVLAASDKDCARAEAALGELCSTYWYPLYAFIRRRGYDVHDAQDLTQEFLARLLEKGDLYKVGRDKGRFRSFLLVALNHFLINEWRRSIERTRRRARDRSAGRSLAGKPIRLEPADRLTAE